MRKIAILGAGLMLVAGGSILAADRPGQSTTDTAARAESSRALQQLEQMKDGATGQKLFYRADEIAELAGLSEKKVLVAMEAGVLGSVRAEGIRLVPANFVPGFLERTASRLAEEQPGALEAEHGDPRAQRAESDLPRNLAAHQRSRRCLPA